MRLAFLYLLPRVVLARIGYSLKVPGCFAVNVCSFTFFFGFLYKTLDCLWSQGRNQMIPLN
jgi:hypothetical protein